MPKHNSGSGTEPDVIDFTRDLDEILSKHKCDATIAAFAHLFVDVVAASSEGVAAYVTFGRTRGDGAPLVTYNYSGTKLYASGRTLRDLAAAIEQLL